MFSKMIFLFVLLVLHCTLGFPQNADFDPTGIAGSFLKPIKDLKEKKDMAIANLFQEPLGVFSNAPRAIFKRTIDGNSSLGYIKKAKDKYVQDIFGLFGDQFDKISKVFNVLGSPSSDKE
ncbi:uncharacterized protein LOC113393057 [Vanessa tameamea]|uniref:Uncharacterized protein LOC113393057 n=1 Tax=Vanessa tameamea TaxID=334116 RepID=A0ABM4AMN3_VANTA